MWQHHSNNRNNNTPLIFHFRDFVPNGSNATEALCSIITSLLSNACEKHKF